jgi:hypothetical protein
VAAHGGSGDHGRAGLRLSSGSGQGHDHQRRGEHLLQGGGGCDSPAPGGARGGGDRCAGRPVGRGCEGDGGAQGWLRGHAGGDHRFLQEPSGQLQETQVRGVPGRHTQERVRQGSEA